MALAKIGFLTFLFLGSFARADFNGLWSGQGSFFQDGRKISDCEIAVLHFQQTLDTLETIRGEFNCHPMIIRSKPKKVEIRDGQLFFAGQLVGVINDNEIQSAYWDATAGWTHQFRLRIIDQVLYYYEQANLSNGFEYYRVEASLKLAPN